MNKKILILKNKNTQNMGGLLSPEAYMYNKTFLKKAVGSRPFCPFRLKI